ncbi:MAG: acyltransferase [Gammaproteobacteria bacterium]|nr:acyltransferase [Gammaproteobacteria bacterium]NNF49367.1 acyltransferase [Woeseiaceae bacterium]MBT8093560.1 acyltransferase [Gammaproteobacteria bacterium]MBT8106476.1 acyltransferase [Gammaproteobacteria bacterium]NNK26491.1 acyltransferase [Woeseiaceae bacterium]
MSTLLRTIRGILVFGVIALNTLFWFVPLMILAVVKVLLPFKLVRKPLTQALTAIGESWVGVNTALFRTACSIDWRLEGDTDLRRDEWYLVMANHLTSIDILAMQALLNRRIPFLKFFIKQQLIWVPFIGLGWWALDMPFMKRYSASYLARKPHMKGKDFETTRRACQKFRDMPTSVMNFVEGTRFTVEKRDRHKDPYRHVLRPRGGGFAVAMSSMGDMFGAILDVTLVYPNGPASLWALCCGEHVETVVHIRQRAVEPWLIDGDYENDRAWRRRVQEYLGDIWHEKDELIQQYSRSVNVTGTGPEQSSIP